MDYTFAALLLVGFLGGGHCVGMCGGIVTALSLQPRTRMPPFGLLLTYNLGRIGRYTLIGGLVGAVGGLGLATLQTGALQQGLYLLANGLLIAMGLYLMGLSRLVSHIERLGKPLWQRIQPLMQTLLPVRSLPQALHGGCATPGCGPS